MEAERLDQIEKIYHAARQIPTARRGEFLENRCGADVELRREVESLLAFADSSGEFIDFSPASVAAEIFVEKENPADWTERTIGHYKIRHLLGKGGMGEVYLAQDMRLDRLIALKIVPRNFSPNHEHLRRRFVREAKAASALNHPHIAHIYEIGESDGVNFIAMEFVEGVSLREKIYGAEVELRTLLKYLGQVADALAKAHAAGIVHRDLKPDNLMISNDGFAKILDFGLAKLVGVRSAEGGTSNDENETIESSLDENPHSALRLPQLTTPGMIMGTVGYMSPEQARGQTEIDARSDIFSFGCILYETVTKQQPFTGETLVDSLHNIIHAPPSAVEKFNTEAPLDLRRIIERCLQKKAEDRYQTIRDVAFELKNLRREMQSASGSEIFFSLETRAESRISQTGERIVNTDLNSVQPTADSVVVPPPPNRNYPVGKAGKYKIGAWAVAALLVLIALGIGYGIYSLSLKPDQSARSLQTAKFARLTTSGKASSVAISPDGKYVVYVEDQGGRQSLWIRQVATQSNVQIMPPAAVQYSGLIFSPDGNYVYYTAFSQELAQTVLFQVPPLGSVAPKKILENVTTSPISFSPDGKQFAFVRATPREEFALLIANADGTEERKIKQFQNPLESISAPSWSPDGKRIAYRLGNSESNDSTVVETQIADGATKPLTKHRWLAVSALNWTADGSGLLILATTGQQFVNQIWHLSYPAGEARQITNDLNNYLGMSLAVESNTLAVVQSQQQASISIAPASDPNNARFITQGSGKSDTALSWTPDGKIVYQSNAVGSNIWITSADGTANATQLTANERLNLFPEVSPDGRFIVFHSYSSGVPHLWRMNIDGSHQQQLTDGASGEAGGRYSPDGRWLVYRTAIGRWTIWKISADGSGDPVRLTDKYSRSPSISPDGKLLAYFYREDNGPWRIAVSAFEGVETLKTFDLTALPNSSLRWMPDNRAVAYVDTQNGVSNIVAQSLDGGKPKQLTDFKQDRIFSFDYSRDGKQLAVSRGTINNDVLLINNFK